MNNTLKTILQEKTPEKKIKSIEAITNKIEKIEQLNADFEILKTKILALKLQVDDKTSADKLNLCKIKEKYVILLINKYEAKGILKWQKDMIVEMITEEYTLLSDFGYESNELEQAFSGFVKQQADEMTSWEKEMTKETLAKMMAEFGFEDDEIGEIDIEKVHDPKYKKDFEQKMKEQFQRQQEKQREQEKQKQVAKTDIDFQKLYKKLAKMTHPDLYKNEAEKTIKELQMQKLTKSWDERNYYDLLMVWLEVDPTNTVELEITAENQKNIIKQLNAQINKIEEETYRFKFLSADTSFYYNNFYAAYPKTVLKKINNYLAALVLNAKDTEHNLDFFQKTTNLKKHLEKVYDSQRHQSFGF